MLNNVYDYLVIGAGAAGLQLVLALQEDDFFRDKKIAVVEREEKTESEKTWCYWETGPGKWDKTISHSWTKGLFITHEQSIPLNLEPYRYKKLDSAAFYQFARQQIAGTAQIQWIKDDIKDIVSKEPVEVQGTRQTYLARHVFDSRIDPAFFESKKYKKVWQHFKGWEIETEQDVFDPEVFTMMDYRIKWKNSTSFTYVLPHSPRNALIEFTFFTPFFVEDEDYDELLQNYIQQFLTVQNYEIKRIEKGIIPMTDYPFHFHHEKDITKIGSGGGWVRPSSGYSFRNTQRYVQRLIANIKNNRAPHQGITRNRFRTYDTLFLDLLQNYNEMGESLFTSMYSKNTIQQIFKFLDEETSFLEDARLISTFDKWPFLKAAARYKL